MILPKPPTTRRKFSNIWTELDYLCRKIRFWLYTRRHKASADRYVNRLGRVLRELPKNEMAIIRAEAWALLCELKGRINQAITYRRREIELMERLHEEARYPQLAENTRTYMLRDRDSAALRERRAILEALMKVNGRQNGDVRRETS